MNVETVVRGYQCVQATNVLAQELSDLSTVWLNNPMSQYHIGSNFGALVTQSHGALSNINKFLTTTTGAPPSGRALEQLQNFDRGVFPLLKTEFAISEYPLHRLIDDATLAFSALESKVAATRRHCSTYLVEETVSILYQEPAAEGGTQGNWRVTPLISLPGLGRALDDISASVREVVQSFATMRRFLNETGKERSALRDKAVALVRSTLVQRVFEETRGDVVSLKYDFDVVFGELELAQDIWDWSNSVMGRKRRFDAYDLFEEPLQATTEALRLAPRLRVRIDQVAARGGRLGSDLRNLFERELDGITYLHERFSKRTWEEQLQKQRRQSANLVAGQNRFAQGCGEQATKHLAMTEKIRSLEEYRRAETFFIDVVRICDGKPAATEVTR